MPIYDFTRCRDQAEVGIFYDLGEAPSLFDTVVIDGEDHIRQPSKRTQPCVQRNINFKAWSLPLAGGIDQNTGLQMPGRHARNAPTYDKDGVAVFGSRGAVREFCDESQRTTNGEAGYSYGED